MVHLWCAHCMCVCVCARCLQDLLTCRNRVLLLLTSHVHLLSKVSCATMQSIIHRDHHPLLWCVRGAASLLLIIVRLQLVLAGGTLLVRPHLQVAMLLLSPRTRWLDMRTALGPASSRALLLLVRTREQLPHLALRVIVTVIAHPHTHTPPPPPPPLPLHHHHLRVDIIRRAHHHLLVFDVHRHLYLLFLHVLRPRMYKWNHVLLTHSPLHPRAHRSLHLWQTQ